MNSPTTSSPKYKNIKLHQKQSPVEIKERMRKNYKDKVQSCRNMLINRFRGTSMETDIRNTLTEIYKSMFSFSNEFPTFDVEENEILEDIKNELVQEELEWCMQEHDKAQMENIDWSSMERDDNVICLVCQKSNMHLENNTISCPNCKLHVNTKKSLIDIKRDIAANIEKHNSECNKEVQFTAIPDFNETHIYIICEGCSEMRIVV